MTTPTTDQCRENALYALTRLSHGYPYEDPNASFDKSLDIETVQAAIQSRPTEEQPAGDRREALEAFKRITMATVDPHFSLEDADVTAVMNAFTTPAAPKYICNYCLQEFEATEDVLKLWRDSRYQHPSCPNCKAANQYTYPTPIKNLRIEKTPA